MYKRKKRDPMGPQGVMPMAMEPMAPPPNPAQHAQFQPEGPGALDMAKSMGMQKGIDAGMEAAAPIAKDAMAAMKAPLMNSTTATTAMKSGVDAGIANAMAGAAPTASGTMGAGAGMMGNAAANLGAAASGAGAAGSSAAGAAGAGGAAAMAGLGAAMPWIGAGLLGAKMFGLFSDGGLVGPLAGLKYKSNGVDASDEFSVNFQGKSQ